MVPVVACDVSESEWCVHVLFHRCGVVVTVAVSSLRGHRGVGTRRSSCGWFFVVVESKMKLNRLVEIK
jgi:hypothetical protein